MKRYRVLVAVIIVTVLFGLLKWRIYLRDKGFIVKAGKGEGFAVAFTPDGSAIACGGNDGTVRFWESQQPPWWCSRRLLRTLAGHRKPVHFLKFSSDGSLLVSADTAGEVRIWSVAQGALRCTISPRKDAITALMPFPDNQTLAISFEPDWKTGKKGWIELWDNSSGQRLRTIKGNGGNIVASPDGRMFVVEGIWTYKNKRPDTVHGELRRLSDGRLIRQMKDLGDDMGAYFLRFSPDGRTLVAIPDLGMSYFYDIPSGQLIRSLQTSRHMDYSVPTFSSDSKCLATGGSNCCWFGANGVLIHTVHGSQASRVIIPADVTDKTVAGLSFSPDGKSLAISRAGIGVQIWRIQ